MDLDVALDLESSNLARFLETMERLKLVPRMPVPAKSLTSPEVLQKMVEEKGALVFSFIDSDQPIRQVDVFLTKELSYECLAKGSVQMSLAGKTIQVASITQMLEIKKGIQQPRDKDAVDIRELTRLAKSKARKRPGRFCRSIKA